MDKKIFAVLFITICEIALIIGVLYNIEINNENDNEHAIPEKVTINP